MANILGVLIDQREPAWIQQLDYGPEPIVQLLPVGDVQYLMDDGVVIIERKTPMDLLASVKDGRWLNQAQGMVEFSPWSYVVVTGWYAPGAGGKTLINGVTPVDWNYNAVQGILLELQDIGVGVYFCREDKAFAAACLRLAMRKRGDIKRPPRRNVMAMGGPEELLVALPGIGIERAAALLQHYGTAAWALDALTDERIKVVGVGEKTERGIRDYLGLHPETVLAVLHPDIKGEV